MFHCGPGEKMIRGIHSGKQGPADAHLSTNTDCAVRRHPLNTTIHISRASADRHICVTACLSVERGLRDKTEQQYQCRLSDAGHVAF